MGMSPIKGLHSIPEDRDKQKMLIAGKDSLCNLSKNDKECNSRLGQSYWADKHEIICHAGKAESHKEVNDRQHRSKSLIAKRQAHSVSLGQTQNICTFVTNLISDILRKETWKKCERN